MAEIMSPSIKILVSLFTNLFVYDVLCGYNKFKDMQNGSQNFLTLDDCLWFYLRQKL